MCPDASPCTYRHERCSCDCGLDEFGVELYTNNTNALWTARAKTTMLRMFQNRHVDMGLCDSSNPPETGFGNICETCMDTGVTNQSWYMAHPWCQAPPTSDTSTFFMTGDNQDPAALTNHVGHTNQGRILNDAGTAFDSPSHNMASGPYQKQMADGSSVYLLATPKAGLGYKQLLGNKDNRAKKLRRYFYFYTVDGCFIEHAIEAMMPPATFCTNIPNGR